MKRAGRRALSMGLPAGGGGCENTYVVPPEALKYPVRSSPDQPLVQGMRTDTMVTDAGNIPSELGQQA
eukprot:9060100-Alexandrium_andersonii.AAC.1